MFPGLLQIFNMLQLATRTSARNVVGRFSRHVHTEKRIADLGLTLPELPQPAGAYKLAVMQNGWVYLAGHL
jgi:hypothetical protein